MTMNDSDLISFQWISGWNFDHKGENIKQIPARKTDPRFIVPKVAYFMDTTCSGLISSRKYSASIAAMQPLPAAVIAWRYR